MRASHTCREEKSDNDNREATKLFAGTSFATQSFTQRTAYSIYNKIENVVLELFVNNKAKRKGCVYISTVYIFYKIYTYNVICQYYIEGVLLQKNIWEDSSEYNRKRWHLCIIGDVTSKVHTVRE